LIKKKKTPSPLALDRHNRITVVPWWLWHNFLILKMLKFSKMIFLQKNTFCEGKCRIFWNIPKYSISKVESSKLINYLVAMWLQYYGIMCCGAIMKWLWKVVWSWNLTPKEENRQNHAWVNIEKQGVFKCQQASRLPSRPTSFPFAKMHNTGRWSLFFLPFLDKTPLSSWQNTKEQDADDRVNMPKTKGAK